MSLRKLGLGIALLGIIVGLSALLDRSASKNVTFIVLVSLGVAAAVAGGYVVFASSQSTRLQMQKALDLLDFTYEATADSLTVTTTQTTVKFRSILGSTWVLFSSAQSNSDRERYLANTLLKYARQA